MKYEIAIPSYKRSMTLLEKTLSYLKRTDVDIARVTIFVADKKESDVYKKVIKGVKIVVGKLHLSKQRNFMRRYYKENTNVLFIDDDVSGLFTSSGKRWDDVTEVLKLNSFIVNAFSLANRFGISLWGINPVLNPFFIYGKGISKDLKYVIGAFYGEVINHSKLYDVNLEDKEDYERTIKHFLKCGAVLRFNSYAPKTIYYKEAGGMQETRTKERVSSSALFLTTQYPKYCKMNTSKKNKEFAEIKLIKQ